jgi:uncharacterized membrane protein
VIDRASIGREAEAVTIVASLAALAMLRPITTTAGEVFCAIDLVAMAKIWRRIKNEIFDSYRPELHYMRGPGPKWREKHARDDRTVSSPR